MAIKIRKAKETEIDTLLHFEQKIIEAERPFDNTLKDGEIHYYNLVELIKSNKAEVLVAEADEEIIGSGYAKIKEAEPFQKFEEYAYVGFMYVEPAFRGQGIAQKILRALMEWAKSCSITEVRLDVYDKNVAAKKAYLKAGLKANLLEMRIEV